MVLLYKYHWQSDFCVHYFDITAPSSSFVCTNYWLVILCHCHFTVKHFEVPKNAKVAVPFSPHQRSHMCKCICTNSHWAKPWLSVWLKGSKYKAIFSLRQQKRCFATNIADTQFYTCRTTAVSWHICPTVSRMYFAANIYQASGWLQICSVLFNRVQVNVTGSDRSCVVSRMKWALMSPLFFSVLVYCSLFVLACGFWHLLPKKGKLGCVTNII